MKPKCSGPCLSWKDKAVSIPRINGFECMPIIKRTTYQCKLQFVVRYTSRCLGSLNSLEVGDPAHRYRKKVTFTEKYERAHKRARKGRTMLCLGMCY